MNSESVDGFGRWRTPLLGGAAGLLVVAFVLAPGPVAAQGAGVGIGGAGELRAALQEAFVGYWGTGVREFSPALADVVDYWFWYHVAKAVVAVALLLALALLGSVAWRSFRQAAGRSPGFRIALGFAGSVTLGAGLVALVAVMVNVQGAVAPYSSVLPMVMEGAVGEELSGVLGQVDRELASAQGWSPAVEVMVEDFSLYHLAMVVIAGLVALGSLGAGVALWRARAGFAELRLRRVVTGSAVVAVGLGVLFGVVAAANATTVADPAPALHAVFDGGW
ncbi:hypothetical protein [Nocardia asteroides]|uniref:hypothetical protein n=1 Tax=Nocardia asteroides TaxID=1824 RepID=UPI0034056620